MTALDIKALTFDVFGTVVDWRNSIAREAEAILGGQGLTVDGQKFALAWRARYQPSMEEVRAGRRTFARLDILHRENLLEVLESFDIKGLDEATIDHLNRAWHRLDPWPDVVTGLERLKRRFILGTLSNGNVALIVNMAKNAGPALGCRARRRSGGRLQAGAEGVSKCSVSSRSRPKPMPDGRGPQ